MRVHPEMSLPRRILDAVTALIGFVGMAVLAVLALSL